MKRLMSIIRGLLFLLILLLMIASVLFVDFVYKTFSLKSHEVSTDAIVVLTGGLGRVDEGVRLFRAGKGGWLILAGVDPSVRKSDLFRDRRGEKLADRVVLEQISRNTLENALYSREVILDKEVRSLLLITSRYHMKRAMLFFRTVLPNDIAIYPHPVDSKNLVSNWWGHSGSIRLLLGEFYKYSMFRIIFLISPSELQPTHLGKD